MPFNLLKKYPELLEILHLGDKERKASLYIGCIAGTSKTTKRSSFGKSVSIPSNRMER